MPKRSRFFKFDPHKGEVVEFSRGATKHRPRYPIPVETLAVHPGQVDEAREYDRVNGVPTDYRQDGTPIIEDSRHYRKYRRLHGHHFRNAYDD